MRITVADDSITFDFSGTDAQRPGRSALVEAVTVSAVAFAIGLVIDPRIARERRRVAASSVVSTEPGSIVAAVPPVAVGAGNVEVSQRVADVCLGALAQAADRVGAASQGTMNNVLVGG